LILNTRKHNEFQNMAYTTPQGPKGNQDKGRAPPALNVESPALTQPFKDYVSKGLVKLFVEFGPLGTQVGCNPAGLIREEGETDVTRLPWGIIKQRVDAKGLGHQKKKTGGGGPKTQPLPLKSLTSEDFEGSDNQLLQRIRAVSTAIGPDVARSRIMTHKLNVRDHDSFNEFWSTASAPVRAMLLMDKKHADKVSQDGIAKLSSLEYPCPFRGSLLPPHAETTEGPKAPEDKGKANVQPARKTSPSGGSSKTPPKGK